MSGEAKSDPFKKRAVQPRVQVKDPANGLRQYGIHGDRHQDTSTLPPPSRRLQMIPISAIRAGRYQKREAIDAEKYQQLKDQIQELGFNFVAILCPDPDDQNYYNPMMGGHLRIQAASELGITEVSAIIRDYDSEALAKGTYFENNGRQALTLIDEGLLFKQCQEEQHWTQEEIAAKLLVPGGRSHVALCLLTVTAPPDIQEMLRKDPKRGQRCFFYLRQLDVLGEEKAIRLRIPLIQDFLSGKLSTDEVSLIVKQILAREQGAEEEEQVSLDSVRRQNKVQSAFKSFQRFEKELGTMPLYPKEREMLTKLRTRIDSILERS